MIIPSVPNSVLYDWITELNDIRTRRNALLELAERREIIPDLAPMLWFSFGTVASLLQEIISIYPSVFSPTLSAEESNSVCKTLVLLECLASHPETRCQFLAANFPLYLYPFINASGMSGPYNYLRLASLGIIAASIKAGDREVINYLLHTEIIPLCLKTMEKCSDKSKVVATFIIQKILFDDYGLRHTCQTFERFSHLARTLGCMILKIVSEPPDPNLPSSVELIRHIIACFLRLAENPRACEALPECIPKPLKNGTIFRYLTEKDPCRLWICQLLRMVNYSENVK